MLVIMTLFLIFSILSRCHAIRAFFALVQWSQGHLLPLSSSMGSGRSFRASTPSGLSHSVTRRADDGAAGERIAVAFNGHGAEV